MPINFKRIGSNIKRIRVEQGMTQKALGRKVGYSGQYIGRLESGNAKAKLPLINALCEMWRVPLVAFLDGALTVPLNREEGSEDNERERKKREIIDLVDECTVEQMQHMYEIMKSIKRNM